MINRSPDAQNNPKTFETPTCSLVRAPIIAFPRPLYYNGSGKCGIEANRTDSQPLACINLPSRSRLQIRTLLAHADAISQWNGLTDRGPTDERGPRMQGARG